MPRTIVRRRASLPSLLADPGDDAMRALIAAQRRDQGGHRRAGRARGRNPPQSQLRPHARPRDRVRERLPLLHGEAIAIGMVLEALLAERLGDHRAGTASRCATRSRARDFPHALPSESRCASHSRRDTRRQESARRRRRVRADRRDRSRRWRGCARRTKPCSSYSCKSAHRAMT